MYNRSDGPGGNRRGPYWLRSGVTHMERRGLTESRAGRRPEVVNGAGRRRGAAGRQVPDMFPSKKAVQREREKLHEMTDSHPCFKSIPVLLGELNRHLRGWVNYFSYGYPASEARLSGEPDAGNLHVRFDEGRVGRAHRVALSPTLPPRPDLREARQ